ncbi:unnamed protein product [Phytophthora fragariaefolia]|uniref:Unnamed protein product n=1 Tax=Phytophthora fragariaefolia TaxID=1490495 RepID=A0A9W7CT40_9STRA|nr:unnamed protein product [Phytophthora fragariaefolia]
MYDPHMAAAAAGGLDAPGLSPSNLQLNARLCRILAERFQEAMAIPSGKTQVLELRIGSRQDGSATAPLSSSSPCRDSGPKKLRRLSHPVSTIAGGSRRKPHQPPGQPYSIPLPGEEGHEEVMDLRAGDDLGAVSDGELLRLPTASSRRRRRRRASSSAASSLAARVARPASVAGDESSFDFDLGGPAEDVELDSSAETGMVTTSSSSVVSTGPSSAVAATSSATVTTVVSAAPTVDSAVVSCSVPQGSSIRAAISSSSATASSSAVLISMGSCLAELASADSSVPTSLPVASSAARSFASCSVASTTELVRSAELDTPTLFLRLAPSPTSRVVTPASSSAGPVVTSAPVPSSVITPQPSSSSSLTTSPTASSTSMSISSSSSAVTTTSGTSSAVAASSVAGSAGASSSVPGHVGAVSVSTPNSAMLRVLGCSRQTPVHQPSAVASTVVTAVPGVSSTSTRPTVPTSGSISVSLSGRPRRKSATIAASLSSHYLNELNVSDRVALGLGGSAESSSDSTSRGAGSSAKPLELLSGSSDAELDSVAASSAEIESHDSSDDSDDVSLRELVSRMQTGRVASHGKAQSYLALGCTPPSSPRSSDSAGALSAQRSVTPSRKKKEKKERRKHKHRHKRRLSELEDSAGSVGDGDRPRRSKRLASSDPAGSSSTQEESSGSSAEFFSAHPAGVSLAVPSSPSSTTASVGVTPHPGVHSTPALPVALRVSFSTLQTHVAQPASRDSRNTAPNARLHDLSFLHFCSARCWEAILERQTGEFIRAGGDRSRISPTPSSLDCRWISSPTKPGNWASLARDEHPTRYFVAFWERTHWVVESGVMMGLHPSQQASHSYEEIADMHVECFQYMLSRKRRSDALRSLMVTVSDDLYLAVVNTIG